MRMVLDWTAWLRTDFTLVTAIILSLVCFEARAEKADFAAHAEKQFEKAQAAFEENRNAENAWKLARAAFDWAYLVETDQQREELAESGISAARTALRLKPDSAPAHFYLGLNLGELARTKKLGALKLIREMEEALLAARKLDPQFDYAGADRTLGMLYLRAPGWPISIGNKKKARTHLERSVELSPRYPENQLALLELYIDSKNENAIRKQLNTIRDLWPKAKRELSGERWKFSWMEWTATWEKLQKDAAAILREDSSDALRRPRRF